MVQFLLFAVDGFGFQDLASWTRMLTCPCWPRLGAVEVPQLQFLDWCGQLIMAMVSS